MLDPDDELLAFITAREKQESSLKIRLPVKRISVFRTPTDEYLVCYDGKDNDRYGWPVLILPRFVEYAFYVNAKGNRTRKNFLIEWEGCSESYALAWPYVIAFDSSFIEIRHAMTVRLKGDKNFLPNFVFFRVIWNRLYAGNISDASNIALVIPFTARWQILHNPTVNTCLN